MDLFLITGYIDMETWKVIVFVVILILLTLGAWYAIKLQWKEFEKRTYVYPKTKHRYMPLCRCRMKCPVSGKWFDAVIYRGLDDGGKYYVRERKDFLDKFVKFIDWKDEKEDSNRGPKES